MVFPSALAASRWAASRWAASRWATVSPAGHGSRFGNGSSLALPAIAVAMTLALGSGGPALAADPFRAGTSGLGEKTGEAFELMFEQNNYREAEKRLKEAAKAEADEPLMYTLQALLAYHNEDGKDWSELGSFATQTETAAKALVQKNDDSSKLRGNLYLAMADFLDGAYAISKDGPVRGMSTALGKLRGIYGSMKKARTIDPNDPELNLVQGFLDMITSIYLPLADGKSAIAKLESVRQSNPEAAYLADWALATGYRTRKDYDKALEAVNRGLAAQPNHAEMNYLKAQLLAIRGDRAAAKPLFAKALQASETMPDNLVAQIFYEACKNAQNLDGQARACDPERDKIRDDKTDPWGPATSALPKL